MPTIEKLRSNFKSKDLGIAYVEISGMPFGLENTSPEFTQSTYRGRSLSQFVGVKTTPTTLVLNSYNKVLLISTSAKQWVNTDINKKIKTWLR
ncbi:MAG: hypothetical protein AABX51_06410, partial [Nanoarchaeota archaeon]